MKRLIGIFAALLITTARAEEAELTVKTTICAKYQGCWTDQCQIGPEQQDVSNISCKLVVDEGVSCTHGFRGNFFTKDGNLVVEAFKGNAVLQIISNDKGTLVRMYEKQTYTGFQCLANASLKKEPVKQKVPAPQQKAPTKPSEDFSL